MYSENKVLTSFLSLVRSGIGHHTEIINTPIDWDAVRALAQVQGLSAIVLAGADRMPEVALSMPVQLKLEWIGELLQNYEGRFVIYENTISKLAGFYEKHGIKMMVLKGYASSLDWPNPKHRFCGDIDIWQFGQYKEADALLTTEKGIKVDSSHHHHTVFYWDGFMVENHYDFINVHHHKSNAEFEKILKKLGEDESHFVLVNGVKVYLPSPNLHALFLLKHSAIEFAASGANLRQLLDWGFFVQSHGKEVDWDWLENELEKFGMKTLYSIYNAICVGDLGFPMDIFNKVQFDPVLKDRVLNEILSPDVPNDKPHNLFKRIIWKWNRWRSNEWKHQLVYKESMWSAFWSGVWGHLLKPSSI